MPSLFVRLGSGRILNLGLTETFFTRYNFLFISKISIECQLSLIVISLSFYQPSWEEFFMYIAFGVSMRSKDPKTQVGCVIVDLKTLKVCVLKYLKS